MKLNSSKKVKLFVIYNYIESIKNNKYKTLDLNGKYFLE